jgi:hypothetical protein
VLWNQAVHTDIEITANRPDIIIKNTKVKPCILIYVAIPANRNITQKAVEKKLPGQRAIKELQKTAILGTAQILRTVLM